MATNLKPLWTALKSLVKPADHEKEIKNIIDAFDINIQIACEVLKCDRVEDIISALGNIEGTGRSVTWDFVLIGLHIFLQLKEELEHCDASVSQQKDLRACLQFIVSLGISPSLLPGVGINMSARSLSANMMVSDDLSDTQKYERLCIVVKALVSCCQCKTLRSLIVSYALGDLLAALCQLSFAPLKKPSELTGSTDNSDFVMTVDFWERLQKDKLYFKNVLLKLISETYQPAVISQLMVLQGSQPGTSPLWLKKNCSNMLTSCLIRPGGVAALIRATFDSSADTGADWEKVETLSKIITSPQHHYENICGQIVKLLTVTDAGGSGFTVVAVACVKSLLEKAPVVCQKFIFDPLLQPIISCCAGDFKNIEAECIVFKEEELSCTVACLHRIFTASSSNVDSGSLPCSLLLPVASFFFKLFCKVHSSVCHLSALIKELLYRLMLGCEQEAVSDLVRAFLFNDKFGVILPFPCTLCFRFGSAGGVHVEVASVEEKCVVHSSVEEAGDNLFALLQQCPDEGKLSEVVFVSLLLIMVTQGMQPQSLQPNATDLGTVEDSILSLVRRSERHVGIVRLLAALAEKPVVQEKIASNPRHVLDFLQSLLESQANILSNLSQSETEDDVECVFVALMVLGVILDNSHENVNWEAFKNLLSPLKSIKDKAKTSELRRLASGMYNTILTHGVVKLDSQHPSKGGKSESRRSDCAEALHDACDALLPVRGHALVQLTKLLLRGDPETISKKEAVLCLFQENLKHDDSFIYLAAVNGLAAIARLFPDTSVTLLTEEFIAVSSTRTCNERNPELQMKVGEVLVKLTHSLGDIAPKYKTPLLNAFLVGARDPDHLMRASSLSNLGEVCRILGFRIGPILEELLLCIQSVVKYDKAVEPRRAALMVVTLLLQGLERDALSVLQDAVLELYRTLKHFYNNDPDDVIRLHAQLALEELGAITRDFIFPKLTFEKKIHLL